jgi:hypothetical protein
MNAIWIAFAIAAALVVLVEGLRSLLPSILRNTPKAAKIATERAEKEAEYLNRREEAKKLVMDRNVLINDRTALESKLIQIQDRQILLDMDRPLLIVEMGEPRGENRLYLAGVSNRFAVSNRVPPGMFDAPLNKIWARENLAEVWAPSISQAKNLLENTYPKARGFEVVFFGEPGEGKAEAKP